MPIKDEPTLADALDGMINALRYCEQHGEHELAYEIAQQYQTVSIQSPDIDWESIEDTNLDYDALEGDVDRDGE